MFYAEGKYICSPPTFRVGCKSMRNMRKGESRINMLELANEGLREINILLRLEVRDLKERLEESSKGQDKEEAS